MRIMKQMEEENKICINQHISQNMFTLIVLLFSPKWMQFEYFEFAQSRAVVVAARAHSRIYQTGKVCALDEITMFACLDFYMRASL